MSKGRGPAAGFVFVTLLLDVVGIGLIIPILPELVDSLVPGDKSAAARVYGPLVTLYALMQTLFSPLIGALSDRYGRRPVLLLSMFGMGCSYILLGFAPSLAWLVAGRIVSGITGATITTANAYMADVSTPETRARNFGLVGAAFGLGFVLGPVTGGILGSVWTRLPFFVAAGVVLLNVAWGLFVLPESLAPEHRRRMEPVDVVPLSGLRHLLIHPSLPALALVFLLLSFGQRGLESIWVLYTGWRFGWTELQNGLSLGVVGFAGLFVQGVLVRRVVPALGEPRALAVSLVLQTIALFLYGLVPVGWMIFLVVPIGALGAMAGPALQGLVTSVVPADRQGSVQGVLAGLQSLTSIFAPLVASYAFAWGTDGTFGVIVPGLPFFIGGGCAAIALVVALRTLRPTGLVAAAADRVQV
jgi:MFS transporter, DHA1 family, tetracycline resistance protein